MVSTAPVKADHTQDDAGRDDDLREFLIVLRRALLLVTDWIERRYRLPSRRP